ncbi:MAG: tetratricopeptide repeat protein [Nitrospirae bacterium]|nr:tetratricopeptide repeat protein [Nitrospirota bacterium]
MSNPVRRVWLLPPARWAGLLLLAEALSGFAPAWGVAADLPIAIDAAKIRAITEDVLASQRDPRGRAQKVDALRAYERFVMEGLEGRSTLRAEAIHRLGDLYTQIETSTYDKRVRDARARGGKERSGAPPSLDRTKSITVYERLLTLYPDRAENDSALYQLARAYWETRRLDEAATHLQHLLTRYPRSIYAAEAAFRLGEYAFATRDFPAAADWFGKAQAGADPTLTESAAYQLGWTDLNLQEYRRAADAFVSILDASTRRAHSGTATASPGVPGPELAFSLSDFSEPDAAFVMDVMKALLLSFDYLGGPGDMRTYFDRAGRRGYEETLYRTLGSLYQAQDRTADAADAYDAFLATHPSHPNAPQFQAAIAETYTKAKWQTALIGARERLVERYSPGTAWANATSETARQAAKPLVKDALYQLALYDHTQAQAARRPDAYERALARHDRFLALFPTDIEAAKIAWLRADALFELGRYTDSSEAYLRAAYNYPLHGQSREAGYAAVVAWERTLPPDGPLSPGAAEGFLFRVNRFLTAFADDARNPDLLMKAAETAARAGLADRALDTAQRLVTSYPSSRWTTTAKRLIGQTFYDRHEYPAAETAFRQALATATGPQAEALATLSASALYQHAVDQRTQGKGEAAAAAFLKVADDFPKTALAPAALSEAADLALGVGDRPGAKRIWTRLLGDYRDSPQSVPALRQLAVLAVQEGEVAKALDWYEALAARNDAPTRDEIVWTMADLAEGARLWPRAERALVSLAERSDLATPLSLQAGFRAANTISRQGRSAEARQRAEATLDRYRAWRAQRAIGTELTPADALAATALLDLADRRAAACVAVRLSDPLEHTLAEKRTALNLALDTYAEAADLKIAGVTTASTHKIGMLLDDFLAALLGSERPRELTPEQLEQYTILLEEQAAPFEERAVAAYETNVRRAQELGVYDEWVAKSFERLAVVRPARYKRPERAELVQRTMGGR